MRDYSSVHLVLIMYRILQYFKFLFSSTNQYGIHSPFVYKYLTKCLYIRSSTKVSKTIGVLLKSIDYFRATTIALEPEDSNLYQKILQEFPHVSFKGTPCDILYVSSNQSQILENEGLLARRIHNESMVLIENIHGSKERNERWNTLQNKDLVTVSIDFFYCGALFFRKEQEKQHFKIRI